MHEQNARESEAWSSRGEELIEGGCWLPSFLSDLEASFLTVLYLTRCNVSCCKEENNSSVVKMVQQRKRPGNEVRGRDRWLKHRICEKSAFSGTVSASMMFRNC